MLLKGSTTLFFQNFVLIFFLFQPHYSDKQMNVRIYKNIKYNLNYKYCYGRSVQKQ